MAILNTANDCIARVRYLIDETSEKNFSNDNILTSLNSSMLDVQQEMVNMNVGYFEVTAELNPNGVPPGTVAGVQEYTLPSDFLSFKRVSDAVLDTPIDPIDLNERYIAPQSLGNILVNTIFSQPLGYYVTGTSIGFAPIPQSAYRVKMVYVQRVAFLTLGTDVPTIPIEWRNMMCIGAAIDALGKDESDIGWLNDLWNKELSRLERSLGDRQHQMPRSVTRTGQSW